MAQNSFEGIANPGEPILENTPDFFAGDPSVTEAVHVAGHNNAGSSDGMIGGYYTRSAIIELADVQPPQA